jgi:diaminopimelate epimerase
MIGMGLSLGCGSGEASIMRGMERGKGEAKESFIPLKGGKKKPEPRMDPAPRMAPGV